MSDTQTENHDSSLSRREVLVGLGAATVVAYSGSGIADSTHNHEHHKHRTKHSGLLDTVNDCLDKEKRCMAHCMLSFQDGSTELADCSAQVHQTHAICQGFASLLTTNSKYIEAYAKLCITACQDCEKECLKHKEHAECKACGDACADVIEQIKMHLT